MSLALLTNPQYWRDRAEEVRVIAERMRDSENKRMMQNIVIGYELLAERAEERLRGNRSSL
jgi:hypothetical protein